MFSVKIRGYYISDEQSYIRRTRISGVFLQAGSGAIEKPEQDSGRRVHRKQRGNQQAGVFACRSNR
ncbi:hypothetical Protein YC6258_04002 [Gynuella sunshinyii YC6258]|uniref:Uncharacterized protein n=1 Tax=Gynuella sunshinyii YC6258 TaxID=1445510 RepID=A0A0C5VRL5_9GAMM|nr:hypothetical Protein YC6258_04002 [Gynuella sunshinyii YC6258]